jgi:hypothetical protein
MVPWARARRSVPVDRTTSFERDGFALEASVWPRCACPPAALPPACCCEHGKEQHPDEENQVAVQPDPARRWSQPGGGEDEGAGRRDEHGEHPRRAVDPATEEELDRSFEDSVR